MALRCTTLLGTLLMLMLVLLVLPMGTATRRPEPVGAATVEATALTVTRLQAPSSLGLANTDANAWCAVLDPNVLRVRFVRRLRGRTSSALPKCRPRRRIVALAEPHEALDTLVTIQLRVLVFPAQTTHTRRMMLLMLVQLIIAGLMLVLTAIQTAAIVVLLDVSLFGCTCTLRGRRLEHGGVLDERLGDAVAGIVRGSVVLVILRIGVVIRHRMRRIGLLRTLCTRGLRCTRALWCQLCRLGGRGRKNVNTSRWKLVGGCKAFDVVVAEDIAAATKSGGLCIVIETPLTVISIITASETTEVGSLPRMLLPDLATEDAYSVLLASGRRRRCVEVRSFSLSEIR